MLVKIFNRLYVLFIIIIIFEKHAQLSEPYNFFSLKKEVIK